MRIPSTIAYVLYPQIRFFKHSFLPLENNRFFISFFFKFNASYVEYNKFIN